MNDSRKTGEAESRPSSHLPRVMAVVIIAVATIVGILFFWPGGFHRGG